AGYAAPNARGVPLSSAPPGSSLLILGQVLGTSGNVFFGDLPVIATAWSPSEILVTVPTPPRDPFQAAVRLEVNGKIGYGPLFTITATPSAPSPGLSPGTGDWPVFMQGPGQSGRAGSILDPWGLTPWSLPLGSKPGTSPVVADGVAYIGTEASG